MGVSVVAGAALLVLALLAASAFFFLRATSKPIPLEAPPVVSSTPSPPPLNIHGIVLADGPRFDPTDVLPMIRERIVDPGDRSEVHLLGIVVRGASEGAVNLDSQGASVTYQYLVVHRDPRAEKALERKGERVEMTLQRDPPPITRVEENPSTKTVTEPLCVWHAAWQAAVASGLPRTEIMDAVYALDAQGKHGVWSFSLRNQPESNRWIDGQTCAIKASQPAQVNPPP
jgi:hypothetical protein